MIKKLKIESSIKELYHYKNNIKKSGANEKMIGNCPNLYGDCTGIYGECCYFWHTESYGYIKYISGNLDECNITDEERNKGINIQDLIEE
jgi:hypothetical protein